MCGDFAAVIFLQLTAFCWRAERKLLGKCCYFRIKKNIGNHVHTCRGSTVGELAVWFHPNLTGINKLMTFAFLQVLFRIHSWKSCVGRTLACVESDARQMLNSNVTGFFESDRWSCVG